MSITSFDVGSKNLAYCTMGKLGNRFVIFEWNLIDLIESRGKLTTFEISKQLFAKLDNIDFSKSSHILIEQQPLKNQRMKNISMLIMAYFSLTSDSKVSFISSKNKLSQSVVDLYKGDPIQCNLKNKYNRRKFFSKKYCEYIIRVDKYWFDYYNKSQKQDDLADCFLQGVWFLNFII